MTFDTFEKYLVNYSTTNTDVDFSWSKAHVQLCFQYTSSPSDNTIEISPCLIYQEIQESTTLESLMKVMIKNQVFGYLNFKVLCTFMLFFPSLTKEVLYNKKFEQYKKSFNLFIQNKFGSIIDSASQLLEMSPDLGLPEIEVELDKCRWESRSLLQWNETMQSIVEWSEHLMIKAIERNDKIVILYFFLPFKLLRIAQELENEAIVQRFNSFNAKCSLLERWSEVRELQLQKRASEIEWYFGQQDDLAQSAMIQVNIHRHNSYNV